MLNFLFSKSLLLKNIRGTSGGALGSNRLLLEDGTFLLKEDAAKHLLEQQPALPTLALSFLSGSTLDPRITFSRGSVATMYDSTGKMTYGPNNLLTYSNTFSNAIWNQDGATISNANSVADPFGGTQASTLTAVSGSQRIFQGITFNTGIGITSIWMRRRSGTGTVNILGAGGLAYFVTGLISGAWVQISAPPAAGTGPGYLMINLGTLGDAVDIYAATFSAVTYETMVRTQDQIITTSSPYYGPRFDNDPVTPNSPRGLLMEEVRTNLHIQSQAFDSAAYVNSQTTINPNQTAAPDGTVTADTITGTGSATVIYSAANIVVTASTLYTASIYVKRNNFNWLSLGITDNASFTNFQTAWFNLNTGAKGGVSGTGAGFTVINTTITPVANGFFRISITYTTTGTTTRIYLAPASADLSAVRPDVGSGAGTGTLYSAWGSQVELGGFALSYIQTGATSVTRLGDVAQMTGTNFTSWYNQAAGTFMVDVEPQAASQLTVIVAVNTTTFSDQIAICKSDGSIAAPGSLWTGSTTVASTAQAALNSGVDASVRGKIAYAYALNDFALSANGSVVVVDSSGTLPAPTKFNIGCRDTTLQSNGWIREVKYFNTRRYDIELKAYGT